MGLFGRNREPKYKGRTVTEWIDLTQDSEDASPAIAKLGSRAIPAIKAALNDANPVRRRRAVFAAAALGRLAEPLSEELYSCLTSSNRFVRGAAYRYLPKVVPTARTAERLAIGLDRERDFFARTAAAEGLALIGKVAECAVPALIRLLGHPDIQARSKAINALAAIGRKAVNALPAIREIAQDRALPDFIRNEARQAMKAISA